MCLVTLVSMGSHNLSCVIGELQSMGSRHKKYQEKIGNFIKILVSLKQFLRYEMVPAALKCFVLYI